MDKTRRNQVYLIIASLILISLGIYLYLLHVEYSIPLIVSTSGIALLISGVRYKERINAKKLTGEERRAYVHSEYFIITVVGIVIFFTGLGGAVLAINLRAGSAALWLLIAAAVGFLLVFAGKILKATDKTQKPQRN